MEEMYAEYTRQERAIRRRLSEIDADADRTRYDALASCLANVVYARRIMRRWVCLKTEDA